MFIGMREYLTRLNMCMGKSIIFHVYRTTYYEMNSKVELKAFRLTVLVTRFETKNLRDH